ncbi:VWA domain-containing protein [Glycomyces luteolus]|uniref:VWA domain-containing protein n=1 Tax=Glycomyces luteolus TaxID=2670330 RepID=A0A9X3T2Q5_9ACTN|nr:vWA domain-containing protein [Glycomyces luteolus]MDA1359050.1 VWA domain-containing protein [Glycomyces luteolus]
MPGDEAGNAEPNPTGSSEDETPATPPTAPPEGERLDASAVARIVDEALSAWAPPPPAMYLGGAAVTIGGLLGALIQLLIGTAPQPWSTVLVAIGIGIIIVQLLWSLFRVGTGRRTARFTGFAIVVFAVVCSFILGFILRPMALRIYDQHYSCADPVELTVLVPADGAAWFQESITEFNREYGEGDCRAANVTAYSAPWPEVEKAMAQGWQPPQDGEEGTFEALRDVGPRPHFWIAESQTQVELADEKLSDNDSGVNYEVFEPKDAEPIGRTPLVLAVPEAVLDTHGFNGGLQTTDRALHELIVELGDAYATPVLRSDPAASTTGLLFFRSLYDEGSAALAESRLAGAAAATGIALAPSDTDLLCEVRRTQGAIPYAAVLTTEMALAHYNTGKALGDDCPGADDEHSGLVPVYSTGLGALDYQGVRLDWTGDPWAGRRTAVADALQSWLAGESSDAYPEALSMRSEDYERDALAGDYRFDTGFEAEADPLSADGFTTLQGRYGSSRLPTTVLLAVDNSASMNEEAGGGRSRFELASDGVVTALDYLGVNDEDQAALWTFPVKGSGSHAPVFDMTADPPEDVAELLRSNGTGEGVDLHQTMVDGIAELDAAGPDEGSSAMVVITDGANLDRSDTTVDEVREVLAEHQANLYLIAVGDVACRSAVFAELDEDPRVTCLEAEEEPFDSLFNQLWSGR